MWRSCALSLDSFPDLHYRRAPAAAVSVQIVIILRGSEQRSYTRVFVIPRGAEVGTGQEPTETAYSARKQFQLDKGLLGRCLLFVSILISRSVTHTYSTKPVHAVATTVRQNLEPFSN